MTALRFRVGELAIFWTARGPSGQPYVGQIVEVIAVGPWKAGFRLGGCFLNYDNDYEWLASNGKTGVCKDFALIKLRDPDQGVDVEESQEIEA
jgi:hypothetical protein